MTTKFSNVDACLEAVALVTGASFEEVHEAWEKAEDIHIGSPQNKDGKAFFVGEQHFAISDLGDGKDVWTIADGKMSRW